MRIKPNVVRTYDSPNKSQRTSTPPKLIVLHSTESHNREGNSDLEGVASWFMNPSAKASSHVIVDGDGNSVRIVRDKEKAWHCVNFNNASLGIEQVGFASYGIRQWKEYIKELKETARWIAKWSIKYNIPITRGRTSGSDWVRSGVVTHKSLGYYGGGHTDPGKYPFKLVLLLAKRYKRKLKN